MTDQLPLQGPEKGECACGCGTFGRIVGRPEGHVRGCTCARCRGRSNRAMGDSRARTARRTLGLTGPTTRHEEHWGGPVRVEVKSGSQVGPVLTRFLAAEQQSEQHRARGDVRPFALIAMPARGDGVVVMRAKAFAELLGHELIQDDHQATAGHDTNGRA